ncbi:hypothetical protein RB195_013989 [Necator americanus]|uniref:Uncharacterized protein n=1 Tax=Necator americanus TaxID=51031 RepID=A0ABR1DY36_NECAM
MLQLCRSRSGNQDDERPDLRAGQKETNGLGTFKSIEDVVKGTKNIWLCAHLLSNIFLLWPTHRKRGFRKQEENAISVIERGTEKVMRVVTRFTQGKERIRIHSYITNRRSETPPHMLSKAKLVGPET